ncbi:MAG: hypothetical protein WCG98_09880 [bacterium]
MADLVQALPGDVQSYALFSTEMSAWIQPALDTLSGQEKKAVQLAYVQKLSIADVNTSMGKAPDATVASVTISNAFTKSFPKSLFPSREPKSHKNSTKKDDAASSDDIPGAPNLNTHT